MSERETLRWQFALTWRLAEHHLPALTDEACLWAPVANAWSVRQDADGKWRPDWADVEPDPAPAVTIGWLTWHLIWWWSSAISAVRNESVAPRESVLWPGSAAAVRALLHDLSEQWRAFLNGLPEQALENPIAYPWREARPLRIAIAWANAELMKNVAEIGVVRHLYENAVTPGGVQAGK